MRRNFLPLILFGLVLAISFAVLVQMFLGRGTPDLPILTDELAPQSQEDLNQTVQPVIFKDIEERRGELLLAGTSNPESVITVYDGTINLGQTRADGTGNWRISLRNLGSQPQAINLISYNQNGARIRSDEVLLRIPAPDVEKDNRAEPPKSEDTDVIENRAERQDEVSMPLANIDQVSTVTRAKALLMMVAPGGPSRAIQSPFSDLPSTGDLRLGPIDYDQSGGVIFSGFYSPGERVEIYLNDSLLTETLAGPDRRWFSIAAEAFGTATYDLRFVGYLGDEVDAVLTLQFSRELITLDDEDVSPAIRVQTYPTHWTVHRPLQGGGVQHTHIYGPKPADSTDTREPLNNLNK